jgi:hypothetical protein
MSGWSPAPPPALRRRNRRHHTGRLHYPAQRRPRVDAPEQHRRSGSRRHVPGDGHQPLQRRRSLFGVPVLVRSCGGRSRRNLRSTKRCLRSDITIFVAKALDRPRASFRRPTYLTRVRSRAPTVSEHLRAPAPSHQGVSLSVLMWLRRTAAALTFPWGETID